MRVSVVVVNYNGRSVLDACLNSLLNQSRQADELFVVDNGSSDGSQREIRDRFPAIRLIDVGRNLGFAAANNLAIKQVSGDVVLLVNNDTRADPEFVAEMLKPFELRERVGAVASLMVFANAPDTIASAGIAVYRNGLALDQALGMPVNAVHAGTQVFGPSAGAAAYSLDALRDVGAFPESFFMYLEDVDLAWRLRLRGWETRLAPRALIQHDYSASSVEGSDFKRRLLARNRLWVIARCVPASILRSTWSDIARYELMALAFGISRFDRSNVGGRVAGALGLGARIAERREIQSRSTVSADALEAWLRPSPPAREMLRLREVAASLASRPGK